MQPNLFICDTFIYKHLCFIPNPPLKLWLAKLIFVKSLENIIIYWIQHTEYTENKIKIDYTEKRTKKFYFHYCNYNNFHEIQERNNISLWKNSEMNWCDIYYFFLLFWENLLGVWDGNDIIVSVLLSSMCHHHKIVDGIAKFVFRCQPSEWWKTFSQTKIKKIKKNRCVIIMTIQEDSIWWWDKEEKMVMMINAAQGKFIWLQPKST